MNLRTKRKVNYRDQVEEHGDDEELVYDAPISAISQITMVRGRRTRNSNKVANADYQEEQQLNDNTEKAAPNNKLETKVSAQAPIRGRRSAKNTTNSDSNLVENSNEAPIDGTTNGATEEEFLRALQEQLNAETPRRSARNAGKYINYAQLENSLAIESVRKVAVSHRKTGATNSKTNKSLAVNDEVPVSTPKKNKRKKRRKTNWSNQRKRTKINANFVEEHEQENQIMEDIDMEQTDNIPINTEQQLNITTENDAILSVETNGHGEKEGKAVSLENTSTDQEDPILANVSADQQLENDEAEEDTPPERVSSQKRKKSSDDEYEPDNIALDEESSEEELDIERPSSRYSLRSKSTSHEVFYSDVEEEEEEDIEENIERASIKRRLRPRNQKQVRPYTHYSEEQTQEKPPERVVSRYDELHAKFSKEKNRVLKQPQQFAIPVDSSSSSSSSSESSDDELTPSTISGGLTTKSNKSKNDKYSHIAPINLSQLKAYKKGRPSADIDPLNTGNVGWDQIGGLQHHIDALKEMVVLPLLYPEIFQRFDITPPRGVIFFGPPGTGKTLVARALASSCTQGQRPIAFFMRKGADILSKWVGEAEKQLRLLFDEAKKLQPSIIFFDEIDGLAPVRSSKQDYIHSSIVSTLLALMDGLDNRGQVVVIGATNRIDSIDPALRRPGRFDRELIFTLPSKKARKEIFDIHTRNWKPPVPRELAEDIAKRSVGYCGADIKALCAESALCALKRRYPQIYNSNSRLLIDVNSIEVQKIDFLDAMKSITPASHRSAIVHARALPPYFVPLLNNKVEAVKSLIKQAFPLSIKLFAKSEGTMTDETGNNSETIETRKEMGDILDETFVDFADITFMDNNMSDYMTNPPAYRPWILLYGEEGMGQLPIARAILYALEELPLFSLDLASLITNQNVRSAEEALITTFAEARKNSPSILWIPNLDEWWNKASEALQSALCSLLQDIPSSLNILVLSTTFNCKSLNQLPPVLCKLFNEYHYHVTVPSTTNRRDMFSVFIKDVLRKPLVNRKKDPKNYPKLPEAPLPPVEVRREEILSAEEEAQLRKEEDATLRELRIRLRDPLLRLLTNKQYDIFIRPPKTNTQQNGSSSPSISVDDAPQQPDNLLYLYDILDNLEKGKYTSLKLFSKDIKQIVKNNMYYQATSDVYCATRNRSKAQQLKELLKSMYQYIPKDLRKKCSQITKRRERVEKARSQENASINTSTNQENVTKEANSSMASINEQNGVADDTPNGIEVLAQENTENSSSTAPLHSNQQVEQQKEQEQQVRLHSETQEAEVEEAINVPDIEIDEQALTAWFDDFISETEGLSVELLEKYFSQMYKLLFKYRFIANRNPLLEELHKFLELVKQSKLYT
jgi:SpoVK/Ycf46/Vps4 family AAA+-type ATPase/predicted nucleic acid-binding protein